MVKNHHDVFVNVTRVISPMCSVSEAATILGIPPTTAQRWAKSGQLPVVTKLAGATGAYVLDRAAVVALAAERAR